MVNKVSSQATAQLSEVVPNLCGNSVRSGWKQLGDTGDVKPVFCQSKSSAKTSASSTNYNCVVVVVDYLIRARGKRAQQ